jgi:hypothetical protein
MGLSAGDGRTAKLREEKVFKETQIAFSRDTHSFLHVC